MKPSCKPPTPAIPRKPPVPKAWSGIVLVSTVATCLLLVGCTQYAKVAERRPIFRPARTAVGGLVRAQQGISDALRRSKREPLAAIGGYLAAAETAAQQLARNPKDTVARDDYNFAVARVFTTIRDAKLDPWTHPLSVPAAGGDFVLTHKPDRRATWNPALYEFTPADQFDVGGAYISEHTTKEGVGAPLAAVGRGNNGESRKDFSLERVYYGVTAVARFSGRRCEIAFEDPLETETTRLNGRHFPLAADFTVPIAVLLASTEPEKMGLSRLLNPGKYAETARIARLQPYDPEKTVVLVVHGLNSSPATWTPMLNALRGDEYIRRNFQFWFYSYPSGYAYPYSASILRKELDAVEKRFPLQRKMVVIGHSMGGCISRLLITDADQKLWLQFFGKPPGQVAMSEESKQIFVDSLVFRHRPEVGRVIFIAAPLQGADMAAGWMGRLGSKLVKAPRTLLSAGTEAMRLVTLQGDDLRLRRIPNSVDTLAPTNRFVKAINTIPLTPGIPYHSIMGDRGKGGNRDRTKPVSSDGLVPYWSSHLEGAQSEIIVPSSHSAHQNPQAIAEVRRILRAHRRRPR